MLDLAAAAVHATRQMPLPFLMESLDVSRARERLLADTRKQLAVAEQELARWVREGKEIIDQVAAAARAAKQQGMEADLSPAIDLIEERIAQNSALFRQARKAFDRVVRQAKGISRTDAALMQQAANQALDFMTREINALSDQGLAYRALQNEFGPADKERIHAVSTADELERLFRRAPAR
jgi:hypothetical protein